MDVRDVLSLTPDISRKRSLKPPDPPAISLQQSHVNGLNPNKISRIENSNPQEILKSDVPITVTENAPINEEGGDLFELSTVGENEVNESTVRKMAVLLEKKVLANQEARTKCPDQPVKFMDSEVELQETLEAMQILAAKPSLYHVLAKQTRALHFLLGLLSHENTDISINVIELFHELMDSSGLKEAGSDSVNPLLDFLFSNQVVQLLTQNLTRLDESVRDEAEAVHKTLGIVESILEVRPDIASMVAQQGILAWALRRLQRRTFDRNKLYVSEVIAILLQLEESNKLLLGDMDGVDILLQQLAIYKRHDPTSREEAEMMYNLFDCLCSALMIASNKDKFLKGEGIQLMNLMLRERHAARDCALRVLDFAMSVIVSSTPSEDAVDHHEEPFLSEGEAASAANCNKFVEVLGLRTIFALFMHTPQARPPIKLAAALKASSLPGPNAGDMEEHIISIVASLLRHCTGQQRARVLAKFVENEHEKVDRLVELHLRFYDQVQKAKGKIDRLKQSMLRRSDVLPEEVDEMVDIMQLQSGLLTLQLIDVTALDICVNGQDSIRKFLLRLLKMRSTSPHIMLQVIKDYGENLGDDSSKITREKARILNIWQRASTMLV